VSNQTITVKKNHDSKYKTKSNITFNNFSGRWKIQCQTSIFQYINKDKQKKIQEFKNKTKLTGRDDATTESDESLSEAEYSISWNISTNNSKNPKYPWSLFKKSAAIICYILTYPQTLRYKKKTFNKGISISKQKTQHLQTPKTIDYQKINEINQKITSSIEIRNFHQKTWRDIPKSTRQKTLKLSLQIMQKIENQISSTPSSLKNYIRRLIMEEKRDIKTW